MMVVMDGDTRHGAVGQPRAYVSGADSPQHGADDQPVERQDGCQVGAAEPIMGSHQRRRGDLLACLGSGDVHDEAKVEMSVVEARH